MKIFRYLLYFYLLFNIAHLLLDISQTISGNDNGISRDYIWYKLASNNENKFSFSTSAEILTMSDSIGEYMEKSNSNEKLYVHYKRNELTIPLTSQQFEKLWFKSQLGLIIYRIGLILISVLMILFIGAIQKGKMFSRKSLILLQVVGILVLIGGILDYAGILILLPTLESVCKIETYGMVPKNSIIITTPLMAVVGYFILAVAFCFGRASYLERENALTI